MSPELVAALDAARAQTDAAYAEYRIALRVLVVVWIAMIVANGAYLFCVELPGSAVIPWTACALLLSTLWVVNDRAKTYSRCAQRLLDVQLIVLRRLEKEARPG